MKTFAILTDSGTDTPADILEKYPVYVAPLQINYSDGSTYLDGVDITPAEVMKRFDQEIPTTSLPPLHYVEELIAQIKSDGFDKIMVVCISSKLSGTLDSIRTATQKYTDLEFAFVDSKNIGIGAGMLTALAAQYLGAGLSFRESFDLLEKQVKETKLFYCIPTLEYLAKGGRIGKVASLIGTALSLVPIITCNEEGVYITVGKARGWNKALEIAKNFAVTSAGDAHDYVLAVVNSGAEEDAERIKTELVEKLPNPQRIFTGGISPALTVHTGPKLVGIGVQVLLRP